MGNEKRTERDVNQPGPAEGLAGEVPEGPDIGHLSGSGSPVVFPPKGRPTYGELCALEQKLADYLNDETKPHGRHMVVMPTRFALELLAELSWFRALVGEPSRGGRDDRGAIQPRLISQALIAQAATKDWGDDTSPGMPEDFRKAAEADGGAATFAFDGRQLVLDLLVAAVTVAKTEPEKIPRSWVRDLLSNAWESLAMGDCREIVEKSALIAMPELVELGKEQLARRSGT